MVLHKQETTRPYIPPTQPNPPPQENGEIKDCYPLCTVVNFIQNPSLSSLGKGPILMKTIKKINSKLNDC